jgi:DNA-binding transcriptional LysR family regulator
MDSSDSLLAMVAAGLGWAITTPLCVLHGHPNFARVSLAPIPGPQLSREILLTHRLGEYDSLADRVADIALKVLKGQVLPEIEHCTPWAARAIASKLASYSTLVAAAS